MPIFFALQPFRGVITLDSLTLYDHGGVTAFDAARGRGDGAGDVAGGQHHRETDSQGSQKGQQDLFDVLLHCAENLVVFVLYGYHGCYGYFRSSASVLFRVVPCSLFVLYGFDGYYGYLVHLHPCNPCDPYRTIQNLRLADLRCTDVPQVLAHRLVASGGVFLRVERCQILRYVRQILAAQRHCLADCTESCTLCTLIAAHRCRTFDFLTQVHAVAGVARGRRYAVRTQ